MSLSNNSVKTEWSKSSYRIPIFSHELLLTSEESKQRFRGVEFEGTRLSCEDSPKEVEFVGNGCPYLGRVYARAAILIWPKSNREKVEISIMNTANKKYRLPAGKDDHPNYDGTYQPGREGEPVPHYYDGDY